MKIDLYLMNKKGKIVLENLILREYSKNINRVICSRDEAVQNDYFDEINHLCKLHNVTFYDRKDEVNHLDEILSIAIGWRWIINSKNLIVLHDSLLPKYRGFAPLVNSLINNEKEVGVTALFANEEYDKGDIITNSKIDVIYPVRISEMIENISYCYVECVNFIFEKIINKEEIKSYPQEESRATYSLWRDEMDYFLDWSQDSDRIERSVNALGFPYQGAKTHLNGKCIILDEVRVIDDVKIEDRQNSIGKIIFFIENKPVVVCGNGLLLIKEARYMGDDSSIFPIKKFRSRFGVIQNDNV